MGYPIYKFLGKFIKAAACDDAMSGIDEYIQAAKRSGQSDSQIQNALKNAGWPEEDIKRSLFNDSIDSSTDNTRPGKKTSKLAVASLICAFIIPLVGFVLGIISLGQIKRNEESGRGYALAAIIISALSMVVSIGILIFAITAYMGVLSPDRMLPERCMFSAGLDCIDKAVIGTGTMQLTLKNNRDFPIIIDYIDSDECSEPATVRMDSGGMPAEGAEIGVAHSFTLIINGCGWKPGEYARDNIQIGYTYELGSDTAQGTVMGRVS